MALFALVVSLVALALAGAAVLRALRASGEAETSRGELVPVSSQLAVSDAESDLVLRPCPGSGPSGQGLEIFGPSATNWLARIEAIDDFPARPPVESPWLSSVVMAALRKAPESAALLKSTSGYRLVFSPEVMSGLRSGSTTLVKSSRGLVAVARDSATGRFVEVGGVLAGGGLTALSLPVLLIAGSIAATTMQQQWLARSLDSIGSTVEATIERLRDADRGVLDAANDLVGHVERAIFRGVVPDQLRYELAVARTSANGAYFARLQYLNRFRTTLEAVQDAKDDRGGRLTTPWVRGSLDAFGEPEDFEAEVLLYLRALVTRARLAGSTAMVLGFEGHPTEALALVDGTNGEIREGFSDLSRRMAPLAQIAPSFWTGRDHKELHTVVTRLEALMTNEIVLPAPAELPAPALEVRLEISAADDRWSERL